MTKRVLVTGGAGFIGSHLAEYFLAKGWAVDIIDDLSTGKRENVPAGASLRELDIRSDEAAAFVRGGQFDAIVHLAAQMDVRRSVAGPVFDASINILGALNLLEALRASGRFAHTRFVFSSTGGALYGDFATPPNRENGPTEPDSPYGVAKLAVEYYLSYYSRILGFDTVSVRFANVYGPRQDPHGEAGVVAIFCGRILEGRALTIFGDGEQTRDYIHVSDVVDATYRAVTVKLEAPRQASDRSFNVGTGEGKSVLELAHTLLAAAGARPMLEFGPRRPGEQQHSFVSSEKARAALGWVPRVSLAEGLADTYAWFAARANKPAVETART